MPDCAQFASKSDLEKAMLGWALDVGVPAAWVTADEAYGKDGSLRGLAGATPIGHVLGVPKS